MRADPRCNVWAHACPRAEKEMYVYYANEEEEQEQNRKPCSDRACLHGIDISVARYACTSDRILFPVLGISRFVNRWILNTDQRK